MEIWDGAVRASAARWGKVYGVVVDPALIHAVIERESRHGRDPHYIATGGVVPEPGGHVSYGPMQVYDTTLPTLVKADSGITGPDLARDPTLGISVGTKYLAKQLARYGGDRVRAVAAYNAGTAKTNAAGQWINQAYVDGVLSFWQRYKATVTSVLPVLVIVGLGFWLLNRRGSA